MRVEYRNILVIQTAFIGDVVLSTSVLEKLHKELPNATISLLVRGGNESLFEDHPFLNEVLVWEKRSDKIKNLFFLLKEVRRKKFDCVISCHRYLSSGILAGFSGAKHIAGFKQNPLSFLFNTTARHVIGDGRHETDRYHELIQDLVDGSRALPKLYPSPKHIEAVKPYIQNKPFICVAPASVWYTKQLPIEKWIELIRKIKHPYTVYLIGAPSDFELCQQILGQVSDDQVINLAGHLSLLSSCYLMSHSQMNYVNDSAPLHFASAMNAPVTAFFCSTIPEFGFGPLSANNKVIEHKIACKPCGLRGYKSCPKKHFKCGYEVNLENIVE